MKLLYALIAIFLLIVASNAGAADLNGTWEGTMYCSDDYGNEGEYFKVIITQDGDFFQTENEEPTPDEICGGVIDGNNISMSCPGVESNNWTPSFAYGVLKGNTLNVISHVPFEGKTCKGVATRVSN
ncbi:hypothetical protein DSCW_36730 [Desulfosarcina widdelii]|uniref:Uncharacterized protein n=1 Tax=Desulfosarcina widdelii TaxID=947919 RepID=A0A5K7Z3C7_9BACT|nr:hypothetical protein [Desulfosarcina widdelii]BBO76256.1 hypothetical protein DSCW_36730 [Desulfosarcina widdelii]